jgi:excisionase family DNA binding protein
VATSMLDQHHRCTYRNTYARRPASVRCATTHFHRREPDNVAEGLRTPMDVRARPWVQCWRITLGNQVCLKGRGPERNHFPVNKAKLEPRELTRLLYSVQEAAELLSCSRSTVYGLIRSGQLVAVHTTSRTRVSRAALVRYVELMEADAYAKRRGQRRATR